MSTEMWKLEKDLCRCCHAEGSFKNLSEPSFQLGQEEIYADMLHECLDVTIVPMTGSLGDVTYTICDSCVARLRDATNFKKQVLDCEERFKDMYSRNLIRGFEVKDEPILLSDSEDVKEEFQSMDDDDDAFLKFDDGDDDLAESDQSVEAEPPKSKGKGKAKPKPKPKAKAGKKTRGKRTIKEETNEDITEAAVSGEKKKGVSLAAQLSSLPYVRLIEGAGAKQYSCSECNVQLGIYSMKRHVRDVHKNIKEECPICDEPLKSLVHKKQHLLKRHNLEEIKINGKKEIRDRSSFFCDVCKKKYTSRKALGNHMTYFHTLRKCPDCPSMFPVKDMSTHRNDVHGTSMPMCGICGYKNAKEDRVLTHQRRVHLREKTVPCELCNLTFFNVRMMKRHLIKHKPDRIHECSYCHKKFPRIGTLRMHEKIHKGEKNKVCSICSERFVQKASLNYHMVKHHPEAC